MVSKEEKIETAAGITDAEGMADGIELGSLLGMADGIELGSLLGSLLVSPEGMAEGIEGSALGMADGIELGSALVSLLGSPEGMTAKLDSLVGSLLGSTEGIVEHITDDHGLIEGVVDGFSTHTPHVLRHDAATLSTSQELRFFLTKLHPFVSRSPQKSHINFVLESLHL